MSAKAGDKVYARRWCDGSNKKGF